jgi:succinoglycan biosynthesis protein ExoA
VDIDLQRLGGWNERWVVNHDAELAARHIAAGGRIVCLPALAAEYVPRSTLRGLWRQYRGYGYYRVATCGRHPESMRPSHVASIVPAVTLLAALLPGRVGGLARKGLLGYAMAALGVSARLARGRDALRLVPVFVAIHFSWGFGFLGGCRAFGAPWVAFASVARRVSGRRPAP